MRKMTLMVKARPYFWWSESTCFRMQFQTFRWRHVHEMVLKSTWKYLCDSIIYIPKANWPKLIGVELIRIDFFFNCRSSQFYFFKWSRKIPYVSALGLYHHWMYCIMDIKFLPFKQINFAIKVSLSISLVYMEHPIGKRNSPIR